MPRIAAIAASVVVVAGLAGLAGYTMFGGDDDRFADCRTSTVAGGAGAIGGPFTLVNQDGETVTDADVITGPSLLYFGYTFCPDICPFDNVRNAEAVDILKEMGHEVTPIFISIDPDRDTPEVMKNYVNYMHEDMIGLTGTPEQVKAASQAYRTFYQKQPSEDEFYLVDHSTFTYLVFPEHGFVEFFRRDLTGQQLAEQVACFVEHA